MKSWDIHTQAHSSCNRSAYKLDALEPHWGMNRISNSNSSAGPRTTQEQFGKNGVLLPYTGHRGLVLSWITNVCRIHHRRGESYDPIPVYYISTRQYQRYRAMLKGYPL